jgi:hypothetical protein
MAPAKKPHKRATLTGFGLGSLLLLGEQGSYAGDWKFGVSLGWGGTGISKNVAIDEDGVPDPNGRSPTGEESAVSVARKEGPGMLAVFAEKQLSDRFTFGLEHARGFRLGPFSSGVSFTGLSGRWYVFGPAPTIPADAGSETTLVIQRLALFVGLAAGVASGEANREDDLVQTLSGSGVYTGFRIGIDYPLAPGIGLRPEIAASSSLLSPATVSEFALRVGLYFLP